MTEELIYDAWTALSFKRAVGNRTVGNLGWLAPTWVGIHARRLAAYKVLQGYLDNAARFFLVAETEVADRDQHREYGDPALLRNQILSALLGEDQTVVVEGADDFEEDADDNDSASVAAHDLQDWFDQWAKDERLRLKVVECERNSVGLGDGVYVVGWSASKERVRLRVFDPGFYFPVLDDGNEDDYPERVHIAWELEPEPGDRTGRRRVRRITWELKDIPARSLAYADKPSSKTCLMTDATWDLPSSDATHVDDFTRGRPTYADYDGKEWKGIDLGIDFIPVVHIPNSVALANHYGRSALTDVLQILDDLANADTDLQASSATTGKPPIALGGASLGQSRPAYRPGEVWETGDGTMTVLDTSKSLLALSQYVDGLLGRLAVNSRLPESVVGRIKPSDVPSGIALALSFGPLRSMIEEMRMVRTEKYGVLFRFVWRISLVSRAEGVPADFFDTDLRFGSFLPADEKATIDLVVALLQAKAISWETGVKILQVAGVPVDDVPEEIRRIQSRDFEGADALLAATNSTDAVSDYLGIVVEEPPEPPTPVVAAPGVAPGPPAAPAHPTEETR